jgi:hypothetical protein
LFLVFLQLTDYSFEGYKPRLRMTQSIIGVKNISQDILTPLTQVYLILVFGVKASSSIRSVASTYIFDSEIQIWWFILHSLHSRFDKMLYSVYVHSKNNIFRVHIVFCVVFYRL